VNVYGAIDRLDLQPGEVVSPSTRPRRAYDLHIQFRMRRAVEGKTMQSMRAAKVFVFGLRRSRWS